MVITATDYVSQKFKFWLTEFKIDDQVELRQPVKNHSCSSADVEERSMSSMLHEKIFSRSKIHMMLRKNGVGYDDIVSDRQSSSWDAVN